jgi:PleD family two-component response regulator
VTLSMGVADVSEYLQRMSSNDMVELSNNIDCFSFIGLADMRLYRAKETGRNRVVGH